MFCNVGQKTYKGKQLFVLALYFGNIKDPQRSKQRWLPEILDPTSDNLMSAASVLGAGPVTHSLRSRRHAS